MLESGLIVEIKDKTMTVQFARSSMCEKCGACERAQEAMLMEVERLKDAKLGDVVQVQMRETTLIGASLLAYGVPLLLLLAGLYVGYMLPAWTGLSIPADLSAAALGLLLAAASFAGLRATEKRRKASGKYAPKVADPIRLCQIDQK